MLPLRSFFQDHVEATGGGENATVPEGRAKRFSCPVAGNPTPNIKWYKGSELSGAPISNEKELEATENGCYTCLASNSLGTSVSIKHCLTIGKSVMLEGLSPNCTDILRLPLQKKIPGSFGFNGFIVLFGMIIFTWKYFNGEQRH